MNKDDLTISKIEDLLSQCRDGYYVTSSEFLDSHEQSLALNAAKKFSGVRSFLYGGYDGAERRMLVCVPVDFPMDEKEASEGLLEIFRIQIPRGSKELNHRDYLGSILGLGLDRRISGDILVRPDGADIIILPEIADFLLNEYHQVGRTEFAGSVVGIEELIISEGHKEIVNDTVASPRLDNLVSSAFKISRSGASDAIRSGLVSVNHVEVLKPDAMVEEGASLVLRGKGKAVILKIGGESKKGRIWVTLERYGY